MSSCCGETGRCDEIVPEDKKRLNRSHLETIVGSEVFAQGKTLEERFGIELELFPVKWIDQRAVTIPLNGSGGILERIGKFLKDKSHIRAVFPGGGGVEATEPLGSFTFEPGGQVEFSGVAQESPSRAFGTVASVVAELRRDWAQQGIDIVALGLNPWNSVDEIGLQTIAPRYLSMDAMYQAIGPFGRRMMRQTATVHVNLDLGPASTAEKRWCAAQWLSPIALATFAHSPIHENRKTGFKSYRGEIWRHTDPSRCGYPPLFLEKSNSDMVLQYVDFAERARLLMIPYPEGGRRPNRDVTFREWMEGGIDGNFPSEDDFRYHLTTLFPEIRPKGFLELRSCDGQGWAHSSVPLTWWSCLLMDSVAIDQVLALLAPKASSIEDLRRRAALNGLDDPELSGIAQRVFSLVLESMERSSRDHISDEMRRACHGFANRFTMCSRTPADDLLDAVAQSGRFDRETLTRLQSEWMEEVGTIAPEARAPAASWLGA